jgi:hypothetical protein
VKRAGGRLLSVTDSRQFNQMYNAIPKGWSPLTKGELSHLY